MNNGLSPLRLERWWGWVEEWTHVGWDGGAEGGNPDIHPASKHAQVEILICPSPLRQLPQVQSGLAYPYNLKAKT